MEPRPHSSKPLKNLALILTTVCLRVKIEQRTRLGSTVLNYEFRDLHCLRARLTYTGIASTYASLPVILWFIRPLRNARWQSEEAGQGILYRQYGTPNSLSVDTKLRIPIQLQFLSAHHHAWHS